MRGLLRAPEIIAGTWQAARQQTEEPKEAEVREALQQFDPMWEELFPAEQARAIQNLVKRVDVSVDGIDITLRIDGLAWLFSELAGFGNRTKKAA